jgi:hypothetical protein
VREGKRRGPRPGAGRADEVRDARSPGRVPQGELAGDLEPAGEVGAVLWRAGAQEEQAVLHARVAAHGDVTAEPLPAATSESTLGDVARLEPGVRADLEDGRAHHAARDCHLAGREARGVERDHALPRASASHQVAVGARGHLVM